jgi:aminobenzoyl-glutamate utilization protein A
MATLGSNLVSPEIAARLVETRRDLHRHPELGLTEFRTASLVAERLDKLGLDLKLGREAMDSGSRVGVPSEAVLDEAYARAAAEGAPAAYLPAFAGGHTAREGYISAHRGVMHACAHDGHTAIGLAVAEVLAACRAELHGTVKFIFQPGEEGGRGALPMVQAGVVDDVDKFIAIHLGTGVPSGQFRTQVYGHLASAKLDVTFRGQAAHAGSHPEEGRNALLAGATAVLGLYGISRHREGRTRVNVGTMRGGSGRNVIADEAFLQIEVRGDNAEITDYMLGRAQEVLRGAALGQGVEVDIKLVGRTTTAPAAAASPNALPPRPARCRGSISTRHRI